MARVVILKALSVLSLIGAALFPVGAARANHEDRQHHQPPRARQSQVYVIDQPERTTQAWQRTGTRTVTNQVYRQTGTEIVTDPGSRTVLGQQWVVDRPASTTVERTWVDTSSYRQVVRAREVYTGIYVGYRSEVRTVTRYRTHTMYTTGLDTPYIDYPARWEYEPRRQVTRTVVETIPGGWHTHPGYNHYHAGYDHSHPGQWVYRAGTWHHHSGFNHYHSGYTHYHGGWWHYHSAFNHYHSGYNHRHCWSWWCWDHWHNPEWHWHDSEWHWHEPENHWHDAEWHWHDSEWHWHEPEWEWRGPENHWHDAEWHWHGEEQHWHDPEVRRYEVTEWVGCGCMRRISDSWREYGIPLYAYQEPYTVTETVVEDRTETETRSQSTLLTGVVAPETSCGSSASPPVPAGYRSHLLPEVIYRDRAPLLFASVQSIRSFVTCSRQWVTSGRWETRTTVIPEVGHWAYTVPVYSWIAETTTEDVYGWVTVTTPAVGHWETRTEMLPSPNVNIAASCAWWGKNGWCRSSMTVTCDATDAVYPIRRLFFGPYGTPWTYDDRASQALVRGDTNGETLQCHSQSSDDYETDAATVTIKVDTVAPTIR